MCTTCYILNLVIFGNILQIFTNLFIYFFFCTINAKVGYFYIFFILKIKYIWNNWTNTWNMFEFLVVFCGLEVYNEILGHVNIRSHWHL